MLLEHTKFLILDDNAEELQQAYDALCRFVPEENIVCTESTEVCLKKAMNNEVDLLILDVEMPSANGFELASYIHKVKPKLKYIFLTGHTELGSESYDYEPIGFLCKPIDMNRLQKTLERYAQLQNRKSEMVAVDLGGAGVVMLAPEKIRYIAKEGRRTMIYCTDKTSQTYTPITTLEAIFEDYGFFRIHQSVLVPLGRIVSIHPSGIGKTFTAILDDGTELPVSRNSYAALRDKLQSLGVRLV